ncbi:MAG TPA: peptide-methionine (S)-S-oxide reductase MsrA [Steroidobacteraceae bacterium]|nr:peptide-methionine (S)-S-oxide reductase MsrA [Steroidobacteraceae bacterium]
MTDQPNPSATPLRRSQPTTSSSAVASLASSATAPPSGLRVLPALAALVLTVAFGFTFARAGTESATPIPAPAIDEAAVEGRTSEVAVLAGGCFWGVQGVFQHVKGVTSAVSGYAGGERSTAEYERVSTGTTGHAESVRVTFDPGQISFGRILQIYFAVAHDPTQLNRQGPDVGAQYRSAVFAQSSEQADVARKYLDQLNTARVFNRAIVTRIELNKSFFPAESYHQDFLARNPTYPYIAINDLPKLSSLKRGFPDSYREDPVLVASVGTKR